MATNAKRFLCMLLAALMVLSTPVSVFAENGTGTVNETESEVSITEALAEAKDGDTVTLSEDTETSIVVVPEKVTLDLNGYKLKATYFVCYGTIVDQSESNAGVLEANAKRLYIREDNEQLPVKTEEGYKFFEVTKFNSAYLETSSKYVFQPFVEEAAHALIMAGAETSGVTVNVRISWSSDEGKRSQDFAFSDALVQTLFASYNAATGKYGQQLSLTLKGAEDVKNLSFSAVVSGANVSKYSEATVINKTEENLPTDNNQLAEEMTIDNGMASAVVPMGTELEEGAKELTLTTEEMDATTSNIQLNDGEQMLSMDVHVNGVSKDNTVPVIITIDEIAPEFLNQGNIKLYHVENGETVEMTRVYSLEEVDAHNEYYYDILTGTITMALASFSEVAVVSEDENAWKGEFDYTWYDVNKTELTIANADQLAAFGAIVGGMAAGIEKDTFAGKTVKLLADINLGDSENENVESKIFYPIGYYNSTGSYEKVSGGSVTSSVSSFEGTFDGNGHTISNFYQNTWEMFGDYNDGYSGTPNHYKDAMGLFGYVVNGTVKNLTVNNFSSDGEFTPTGVIAAYAVNSTFENIAITNCNPRVYNTGNGGIVGIGGNNDDPDTYKLTFNNITIDNSNKITALWGSWDVACGGLVGMFRGAGHVDMTNCHVAAQIDVYNDVCGNYQYYWYRYAGMLIGTNKTMITDADGYTVPETSKFYAEGCTVHFGDWNNYYYCELVANSLASYTHDHQFSRLTEVDSIDVENMTITVGEETTAIPKSGRQNYVVVNGEPATEHATCYHFVDGLVWNHDDAGKEMVNGVEVLKENNQHIYLPFNQLFTGYGWGVKHVPIYDDGTPNPFNGVTILDRVEANSVKKFAIADTAKDSYTTETTVNVGELFKAIVQTEVAIDTKNVQVSVSPVGEESTAGGTYEPNGEDWTLGKLTFSGIGAAQIIITDYNFCEKTVLNVTIEKKVDIDKFVAKEVEDIKVGDTVKLGDLFTTKDGVTINDDNVEVNVTDGTYEPNSEDWTLGTITFNKAGKVTITITDKCYCNEAQLILKVVEEKFIAVENVKIKKDTSLTLDKLFNIKDGVTINDDNVEVNVTDGTYEPNSEDWTLGTITFNEAGKVTITITDGQYCVFATANVTVVEPIDAFEYVFPNTNIYLYRVGNKNAVSVSNLFKVSQDINDEELGKISINVTNVNGDAVEGLSLSDVKWNEVGSIDFEDTFTGPVKVTIESEYAKAKELYLEVVDAKNITKAESATANNVVLLNDISGTFVVSNGHTFYGNGFTVKLPQTSVQDLGNGFTGYISIGASQDDGIANGGNLDNVRIEGPVYPEMYIYRDQAKITDKNDSDYGDGDNMRYFKNSVIVYGGNCTISNSYISGSRTALCLRGGNNVVIENTTLSGGAYANMQICAGSSVTLRDLTTVQVDVNDSYGKGKTMHGLGIAVDSDVVDIYIEGTLNQYNWINKTQWDKSVPSTYQSSFPSIFTNTEYSKYWHYLNGKTGPYVNMAFVYACNWDTGKIHDNRTSVNYETKNATIASVAGGVYSKVNTVGGNAITDKDLLDPGYTSPGFNPVAPVLKFDNTPNNDADDENDANDTYCVYNESTGTLKIGISEASKKLDLSKVSVTKDGSNLAYTAYLNGNKIAGNSVEIKAADGAKQTLTFKATSKDKGYDKVGNPIEGSIEYTWTVNIEVATLSYPAPVWNMGGTYQFDAKTNCIFVEYSSDYGEAVPIYEGIKVIYYDKTGTKIEKDFSGTTVVPTGSNNSNANAFTYALTDGSTLVMKYVSGWKSGATTHQFATYKNKVYVYPQSIDNSNYARNEKTAQNFDVKINYTFTDPNGQSIKQEMCWYNSKDTNKNVTEVQWKTFDTVYGKKPSTCVTADTLVTLADGSQKRIDEITYEDQLKVWNFYEGRYDTSSAAIIFDHEYENNTVVKLVFEDGTEVKVVNLHQFYDATLNSFVDITEDTVSSYVGHGFIKQNGDCHELVELVDYEITEEYIKSYGVISAQHYNVFVEGMLSTDYQLKDKELFNYFEINENLMYDLEKMQSDIKEYGLYTYEEFDEYLTRDQFEAFNIQYMKIPVGKGLYTYEGILELIAEYLN